VSRRHATGSAVLALIATLVLIALLAAVYAWGRSDGKAACQAAQTKTTAKAVTKQRVKTQADINRGARTGAQHEANQVALDTFFDHLAQEQTHAPSDPVDGCVLPADRLRLWNAANAGPQRAAEDAAAAEPDGAATPVATSSLRRDARLGGEPPRGGEGLPPAGIADLWAARVPADPVAGVPGVAPGGP
jgi:hypothetical protein